MDGVSVVFGGRGVYVAAFVLHNPLMRDVMTVPLAVIGAGTVYMVWARVSFQSWERQRRREWRGSVKPPRVEPCAPFPTSH